MDKIFTQSQKVAATEGDKWFVDEALTQEAWDPKWWNFADQAINVVNFVDELTGFGYAGSILVTTVTLRACIFPLAVRGQRASSRMAHLQPELAAIKQRYEALGTPSGAEQKAFAENMKGLFARYEVTPFAALATPLIQAPMFIGMFFGMKKIPDLFPEQCANGGLWWFTDLTIADPTYILPLLCGISFIATIESGKEQMIDSNPQHGPVIVNVFRAMAVVMVPVITTFPAATLCYWVPNNFYHDVSVHNPPKRYGQATIRDLGPSQADARRGRRGGLSGDHEQPGETGQGRTHDGKGENRVAQQRDGDP